MRKRFSWSVLAACTLLLCLTPGCFGKKQKKTDPQITPSAAVTAPATVTDIPAAARTVIEPDLNAKNNILKLGISVLPEQLNPLVQEDASEEVLTYLTDSLYRYMVNDEVHPLPGVDADRGYVLTCAMAASMPKDVTKQAKQQYGDFLIPEEAESGYAFEIELNPKACWDDKTPINADTYVYSFFKMLENRENTQYSKMTECGVIPAGAEEYANAETTVKLPNHMNNGKTMYALSDLKKGNDGVYVTPNGETVYFGLNEKYAWLGGGETLSDFYNVGIIPSEDCWEILNGDAKDGYVKVTDRTLAALYAFTGSAVWDNEPKENLAYYMSYEKTFGAADQSKVGFLKTGEFKFLVICQYPSEESRIAEGLNCLRLIRQSEYEAENGKEAYGQKPGSGCSYGPYRLEKADGNELVLERNVNWYGYYDSEHVFVNPQDGKTYRMYQTDGIRYRVVPLEEEKTLFDGGELSLRVVGGEERVKYQNSDRLFETPGENLYFLVINGNEEAIEQREEQDEFDPTQYDLQTLLLMSFRRAVAMSIDKAAFCAEVSSERMPFFGLIGEGFTYSKKTGQNYRDSESAQNVLINFYSTEGAETGYSAERAKMYFNQAFSEAISLRYITDLDNDNKSDQTVRIEYCVAADTDIVHRLLDVMNREIAKAAEGTPFEGKIEIVSSVSYGNDWGKIIKSGFADMATIGWKTDKSNPYELALLLLEPGNNYCGEWLNTEEIQITQNIIRTNKDGISGNVSVTTSILNWGKMLNGIPVNVDGTEINLGEGYATDEQRLQILSMIEARLLYSYDYIPLFQSAEYTLISDALDVVLPKNIGEISRTDVAYLRYR